MVTVTLDLTVPAYFHQAGLDTAVFGDQDWHARGNFIAGLPPLGVGTNGHVAWSFTCFYADPIDYFREVIQLDDAGRPTASRFGGEWKPLSPRWNATMSAPYPLLDSEAATIEQPRFATFDGRRILSIEGRPAMEETGINLGDGPIVVEDVDGDGEISAIELRLDLFRCWGRTGRLLRPR